MKKIDQNYKEISEIKNDAQAINIAQGQSTGRRVAQAIFGDERYTSIKDRCVQVKNFLLNAVAVLFVLTPILIAFFVTIALKESTTFDEFFTTIGLSQYLDGR